MRCRVRDVPRFECVLSAVQDPLWVGVGKLTMLCPHVPRFGGFESSTDKRASQFVTALQNRSLMHTCHKKIYTVDMTVDSLGSYSCK